METTENNRLIADFMGLIFYDDENQYYSPDGLFVGLDLQYHTSWDWLMPVVEKIEMLGYTFEKNYQKIDGDWQSLIVKGNDILFQEFNRDSKLSTCYVVVEFIQWYKNQN